jgi:hypothetical protein
LGKGVKVVPAVVAPVEETFKDAPAVVAPVEETFKDAPVVVAPGEEALKLSGKEAAADKAHLEGSGKVVPAVVAPVEETFKDAPAAVAPVEETFILSGKEAGADKAHLGKVGKEKVPPGEGSGKNKSKAAASGVTEKKKKGKEAGKRRRDDKKLVDVDTSKNNKKVQGKKSDKDVALKDTVDVDDGVHIRKKMSCLSSPFVTGIAIETKTCHLKLCDSFFDYKNEVYEQMSVGDVVELQAKLSNKKNQLVETTEEDIKTLEPGKFHFYTELAREGYDGVAHWTTAKKAINIFQKKLILIPINIMKHWSLCAVMNHRYIDYGGVTLHANHFQVPVMIFLDSLKLHSIDEISENVRMWLNEEYNRINNHTRGSIFNAFTIHNVVLEGNDCMKSH